MVRGGRTCETFLLRAVLGPSLSTFGAVVTVPTRLLCGIVNGLVCAILIVSLTVDAYRPLIVAFDLDTWASVLAETSALENGNVLPCDGGRNCRLLQHGDGKASGGPGLPYSEHPLYPLKFPSKTGDGKKAKRKDRPRRDPMRRS